MTNSRLTDPEVLEWRYPGAARELRASGAARAAAGKHRGGDGVVRRIRFREAMTAAILSSRRRVPPFGLAGGEPGARRPQLRRARRRRDRRRSAGTGKIEMDPGDVFVIETPGGGGYGVGEEKQAAE